MHIGSTVINNKFSKLMQLPESKSLTEMPQNSPFEEIKLTYTQIFTRFSLSPSVKPRP
jgi:hypothetical protein